MKVLPRLLPVRLPRISPLLLFCLFGWTALVLGVFLALAIRHSALAQAAAVNSSVHFPIVELLLLSGFWLAGMIGLLLFRQRLNAFAHQRDAAITARNSQAQELRSIFDSAPVIMLVVDDERRVCRANRVATAASGSPEAEMIGKLGGNALHCVNGAIDERGCGYSPACGRCEVRLAVVKTLTSGDHVYKQPARLPLPDGTHDLCVSTTLLQDTDNRRVLVVIDDVTESYAAARALQESNRRLEQALAELQTTQQQMLHQERLAAVGQFSAGIAHDFNNILTSIFGYTELLQLAPDTPPAMQRELLPIVSASERAAHLVRQLLDFSRQSTTEPRHIDAAQVVQETCEFLGSLIPETVRIRCDILPGRQIIEADPTQLQQVLTNLALNARDAMPDGGELLLRLNVHHLSEEVYDIDRQPLAAGDWLCLSVEDTGSGIAPEVLPRIFEPFFTTKDTGAGTGLGLAQVYGIIAQHHGHLTVQSRPGHGTRFMIYLPLVAGDAQNQPALLPSAEPIRPGHDETVLLVEDDPTVLDVTAAMLRQLGYRVLTAATGAAALSCYADYRGEISLVLTDMVMPEMDGPALFYALHGQDPELPVVIMSGYPPGARGQALMEQGCLDWLQKPVTLQRLRESLQQAMMA
jgi:signal transduction histidine kinase/ActR/RegA family two-component response regulator